MLFKFKSRASADLIMLEGAARQLLAMIGKTPEPHGIVTVAQIPAAIAALQAAVAAEEAARCHAKDAPEVDEMPSGQSDVSLRQRATPFIAMLRRSAEHGRDVFW